MSVAAIDGLLLYTMFVGGSLGVNSEVKVESRPLTQQGLMTSRSNCQGALPPLSCMSLLTYSSSIESLEGRLIFFPCTAWPGPGRQVQDKTYYLSKIRIRKQELQAEIDIMNEEIEKLQKREPANVLLEKK